MTVAVTGGTGFIGSRLVNSLVNAGDSVVVITRGQTDPPTSMMSTDLLTFHEPEIESVEQLSSIFEECDAVAHLAGINHERGRQTYERVHCRATHAVVRAAEMADVNRMVLTSYLRARPNCGSSYLESKWIAEELTREAALDTCILKPAGVFGRGDQFLTGLTRWLRTIPIVSTVGIRERPLRPVAVSDVVAVIEEGLFSDRLAGQTIPLLGPTQTTVSDLVQQIGRLINRSPVVLPAPIVTQRIAALIFERLLDPPLVTRSGVRMLAEGMVDPAPAAVIDSVPPDLEPEQPLDDEAITRAIRDTSRYGLDDIRAL